MGIHLGNRRYIFNKEGGYIISHNKEGKDLELESINEIYRELADLIGIDKALKIYKNYKGLQVNFPTRLYDRDYVINQAIEADEEGQSIKHLAVKYEYSERWIREIIQQKPKEKKDDEDDR